MIPAHPLALTASGRFDERSQRGLTRYYVDAGAIGVAVGVHTTQFAIRDPKIGLFRPVLELAAEVMRERAADRPFVRIAGVLGPTRQAIAEARLAAELGYHVALVSLGGLGSWSDDRLIAHVREIASIIPVMGFYLQPAVGGRLLGYRFWRRLAGLGDVVAIKIAPFNRYQTLDVIRGVVDAGALGRIALYTGNDDSIVTDLVTPFRIRSASGRLVTARIVGGLLGHWAFWTRRAVELVERCKDPDADLASLLALGSTITQANAAIFDAANGYRGCIPGITEVLRRQGLMRSNRCLDPKEKLSPGQAREIGRVMKAYGEPGDPSTRLRPTVEAHCSTSRLLDF